jgi:hypothetical protein
MTTMNKFWTIFLIYLISAGSAFACNSEYNVTLETFGEGVLVELRSGSPGSSSVVRSTKSSGGVVRFNSLCPGNYFLAIGNGDNVSVTQTRYFENDSINTSLITLQRGSGNVSSKSRKSL